MSIGLIGRKVGMTQVFGADGVVTPVTVLKAGPCVVTQVRTPDTDADTIDHVAQIFEREGRNVTRVTDAAPRGPLKKTPLHAKHLALGAKMADFGGWPIFDSGPDLQITFEYNRDLWNESTIVRMAESLALLLDLVAAQRRAAGTAPQGAPPGPPAGPHRHRSTVASRLLLA